MQLTGPDIAGDSPLQRKIYSIIFKADTPAGKAFDIVLLIVILISVIAVMLETVEELDTRFHNLFIFIEWTVTILFTIEYLLRMYCVKRPMHYIWSFYGVIDLLSIAPTYLSLLIPGSRYLLTIRAIRLLRIFRILKLARYLIESEVLKDALSRSRFKITVFLGAVLMIVLMVGTAMYLIESPYNDGFSSIPRAIYWAIVTVTTVGFGDIIPMTIVGQVLASLLMVTGYAIIAVPTGIVSVELAGATERQKYRQTCDNCGLSSHDPDARYCKKCGNELDID
jgi:voltage-gated potassium channel